MLVNSKLPTTFLAEVVNTACNVLNRALVIKPHNKTTYELIHGKHPLIDFMKSFGCPVTILNTRDHLGKFDRKAYEGLFVGYSVVSKAMRVFNKRTKIVEETLNIRFLKNAPNVKGNRLDWLFDIDSLTISMNYEPVIAEKQTNGIAGTKDNIVVGQAEKKKEPEQEYILIPICTIDPLVSQDKWAISTKWVFRNKKDERGIVVKKKARLVNQGHTQKEDFVFYQMDVKSAFLYGRIEEEAPRAWYKTLSTYLMDNGFYMGQINKTLFIKRHKDDILLVQVYVDDIIFGSTKKELIQQKSDGIFISQEKYVAGIFKKFYFSNVKKTSTLMEPLIKDAEAEDVDVHLYRSMISSLMYLTASRPDNTFSVCACASYAGASLDRKSITGGCQFLSRRLISWQCKKQTIVANSTIEAEYVATVPTPPYDSPLPEGHTPRGDDGSLTLNELTVLCTTLSNKVEIIETDLKLTKQTYGAAFTKLIKKVKKLKKTVKTSQARRRAKIVISDNDMVLEDSSKQERIIEYIDQDA
uniref:Putative ribonuclease H-like domain-containing protein n=1 Tax=Tanacetum cinerariifolium TaxID=118510 RepID=A0A699GH22_TANCI|nr:putative ribonuclease H-like domain-containing protein [Tanacetum cinerariifolium]